MKILGYALFVPGAVAALVMMILGPLALWRDEMAVGLHRFAIFFAALAAVKAGVLFLRPEEASGWPSIAAYLVLSLGAAALSMNQPRSKKVGS